jgi:hypothetical protein
MMTTLFRVSLLQNRQQKQLRDRALVQSPTNRGEKVASRTMIQIIESEMLNISKNSKLMTHWELSMAIKNSICKANQALSYRTTLPKTSQVIFYRNKRFLPLCHPERKTLDTPCLKLRKKMSQMIL